MADTLRRSPLSKLLVVHCMRARYDVYIGRAMPRFNLPPSKWGNPRRGPEATLDAYERYILSRPALLRALPELRGKVLGCWCAPGPCHGDVLVRLANTCQCERGPWCVLHRDAPPSPAST